MFYNQTNNGNNNDKGRTKCLEKKFHIQNSILTEKFQNNGEIKTVYNFFILIHVNFLTYTILQDYIKTGQLNLGLRLIVLGFNKFYLVILFWCVLNLFSFLTYYYFTFWAKVRIVTKPDKRKVWDFLWIGNSLFYFSYSFYSMYKIIHIFDFAAASAAVLFVEEMRLLMKQYAFIRANVPRVLTFNPHAEKIQDIPNFRKFIYFLFAPTMVYRDEYPRTQNIRWRFVFSNIGQCLCVIWFFSLLTEKLLVPLFKDICLRKYTAGELIVPVLTNSLPGMLGVFAIFYSVVHTSQNAAAELLRFGDRMFYGEWWSAKSLSEYYRAWNIPMYDWLFIYIYKDFYEIIVPKNKMLAQVAVFLTSAVFHELIITGCLRFFFPVQFLEFFVAGSVFAMVNLTNKSVGNLFVLYALFFGAGMQGSLYTLEFFAHLNCPMVNSTGAFDFLKPRFVTCDCIK